MSVAVKRAASTGTRNAAKAASRSDLPPWKADARWKRIRTRHGRAIKFIETYCKPPKGYGHGKPMKLAKFQKEDLEAILADGVDTAVQTMPRGQGKSTEGGALATWAVFDDDETGAPQVPIIATKITQAIRSCYGVAAQMIAAEPELASRSIPYTGLAAPRIVVPYNNGEMFPMANDTQGLQGLDYSFALFDEIGFQSLESWNALTMAEGKRERALALGVGTRGLDQDNALAYLSGVVAEGGEIDGFVLRDYTVPMDLDYREPKTWRMANPAIGAGFLRESALAKEIKRIPESYFRIFRLNQTWEGADSWLGEDGKKLWAALNDPYEFKPKAQTWVGVDVGLHRDSTAVVWVQKRPDGHLHAKCKIWMPQPNEAVQLADVRKFIRDLSLTYDVQAVSYDPRFFADSAQMLEAERVKMIEIPQTVEYMTPACGGLLTAIKNAELRHDGQPDFTTHVLNAVAYPNERGFTLKKSKSRGKIDGCIALALAMDRATLPVKPRPALFAAAA